MSTVFFKMAELCWKNTAKIVIFDVFLKVDPFSIDPTHRVFCAHFVRIPAHTLRHEYYRGAVGGVATVVQWEGYEEGVIYRLPLAIIIELLIFLFDNDKSAN